METLCKPNPLCGELGEGPHLPGSAPSPLHGGEAAWPENSHLAGHTHLFPPSGAERSAHSLGARLTLTYIISNSPGDLKREAGPKTGPVLQISKPRLRDVKSLDCSHSAPWGLHREDIDSKSGSENYSKPFLKYAFCFAHYGGGQEFRKGSPALSISDPCNGKLGAEDPRWEHECSLASISPTRQGILQGPSTWGVLHRGVQ